MSEGDIRLSFIIIGAGIGGLTTAIYLHNAGHSVTVLEKSSALQKVGAGIQIMPNASRILERLGIKEFLEISGVKPQSVAFFQHSTGNMIGEHSLADIEREHGCSYYNIHRGHLLQELYETARGYDVDVKFDCSVTSIDFSSPSYVLVKTENGENFRGDAVIGADGIHSITRQYAESTSINPAYEGDLAFRAVVPAADLLNDEDLSDFIKHPRVSCWLGPGKHFVSYCLSGGSEYNMVVTCQTDGGGSFQSEEERLRYAKVHGFTGWNKQISKLLNFIDTEHPWKLMDNQPLTNWTDKSNRLLLIGDACHAMLPYRAQGAAMALEDAAVLGELFQKVTSKEDVGRLLLGFQTIRQPRCSHAQMASRFNRTVFHLPDGVGQIKRDEGLKHSFVSEAERRQLFDYDPVREVDLWRRATAPAS